ncbi:MAG: hypothetical protein GEU79_07700 [Acidimicrobiia bacterium]|nr:hypothetical protein [Acidimicrobiia bacterium]
MLVVMLVVSMLVGSLPMALVGAEVPDFADSLNGSVEGVVWSDSNSDDTRSDEEESFENIELSLVAADDTVVDSAVSGDSGDPNPPNDQRASSPSTSPTSPGSPRFR